MRRTLPDAEAFELTELRLDSVLYVDVGDSGGNEGLDDVFAECEADTR